MWLISALQEMLSVSAAKSRRATRSHGLPNRSFKSDARLDMQEEVVELEMVKPSHEVESTTYFEPLAHAVRSEVIQHLGSTTCLIYSPQHSLKCTCLKRGPGCVHAHTWPWLHIYPYVHG